MRLLVIPCCKALHDTDRLTEAENSFSQSAYPVVGSSMCTAHFISTKIRTVLFYFSHESVCVLLCPVMGGLK